MDSPARSCTWMRNFDDYLEDGVLHRLKMSSFDPSYKLHQRLKHTLRESLHEVLSRCRAYPTPQLLYCIKCCHEVIGLR